LPTPEFAATVDVDEEQVKKIMNDSETGGVTADFFQMLSSDAKCNTPAD
jgi:hypothetical protein